MNFFGDGGLSASVSARTLKKYGSRELQVLAADLKENRARWRAESGKYIILIKFSAFRLYASKGESEYEAMYSNTPEAVATFSGLGKPSTQEVIDLFRFRVSEEQIVEFSS